MCKLSCLCVRKICNQSSAFLAVSLLFCSLHHYHCQSLYLHHYSSPISFLPSFFGPISLHSVWFKSVLGQEGCWALSRNSGGACWKSRHSGLFKVLKHSLHSYRTATQNSHSVWHQVSNMEEEAWWSLAVCWTQGRWLVQNERQPEPKQLPQHSAPPCNSLW